MTSHCAHWYDGDGACCADGEPNWCPESGETPEALAQYERRKDACTRPATNYACEVCGKHPRDGHTIIRTSPKGEPFLGRCENDYKGVPDAAVATIAGAVGSRARRGPALPTEGRDHANH